jgi:hypothetical protein
MRKPNPIADKVTKHVLEYLLNRFQLAPGDINNIRLIISKALSKNLKNPKNIKAP